MVSAIREIAETLIAAVFLFFVIQAMIQNFQVIGPSMQPTIHSGQLLLVSKAAYMHTENNMVRALPVVGAEGTEPVYVFDPPQRGDIIVFHDEDSGEFLIKRVVGRPGEVIEIRRGQTLIDGRPIEEPYVKNTSRDSMSALRLDDGEFFMMGDNRPYSRDSRSTGPVDAENIVGKAWFSFWPLSDFGFMDHFDFEEES